MRAIVNVATGRTFCAGQSRLLARLEELHEPARLIFWVDSLPPNTISEAFAFKLSAIEEARERGAKTILWMDSSIVILKPLEPLWNLIESQGYWFSSNYGLKNGEFVCDDALEIMGISREEQMEIPHVVATTFGLDFTKPIAQNFLREWKDLAMRGAFRGPHDGGSIDPRVKGHRHDQSAAAVVAWKLQMKLTDPPAWFADEGYPGSEETILTAKRPR